MSIETVAVRCSVVGGGPAGTMLGLLLARAGVDVLVTQVLGRAEPLPPPLVVRLLARFPFLPRLPA